MKHDMEERTEEKPDDGGDGEAGRGRGRKGREHPAGRSARGGAVAYISLALGVLSLALAAGALYVVRSGQEKVVEAAARVNELSQRLAAANEAFSRYQASVKQQKALENETNKRLDERDALIIHALTQVQTRLKVSPTLEKMLEPVGAPAAAPAPEAAAAAAPPQAPKAPPPETAKDKIHSQVQGIRDAIRKFNEN